MRYKGLKNNEKDSEVLVEFMVYMGYIGRKGNVSM